jgi:Mrp family chromosome partitioning ATPase
MLPRPEGYAVLRSVPSLRPGSTDEPAEDVDEHWWAPDDIDDRCVVLREPASPQARGFRLLRHRLLAESDPHIVSVTSAVGGEGKTTCAVNLALCMAEETFASVLLLEANPCRPSLAQVFDLAALRNGPPANTSKAAGAPVPQVYALPGTQLRIATVSACAVRQGRLDRVLLDVAMRELRETYEYVVIDTASVLESADANIACECADGVVVTARAAISRRSTLQRALDQLRPASVCGIVLLDA